MSTDHNHHFDDLADHELLRALQRETLDTQARDAALRELQRRRLALPSTEPAATAASTPATIENYDFAADRFADNPYQTPQSAPPPGLLPPPRTRIVNALWWLHIAAFALYTVAAFYDVIVSGRLVGYPTIFLAVLVLCVVGMVGWRLQRALLHQWLWGLLGVGALLYSVVLGFSGLALVFSDVTVANLSRLQLFGVFAASLLIVLPLTFGLTGYAFRSKSLW